MNALAVRGLEAGYGPSQALFGVDFEVGAGEALALMGRNGAGKTTTIRAICGLLPALAGSVTLDGRALAGLRPERVARLGVGLVPEGRRCFADLTVRENLLVAARPGHWTLGSVATLFPPLAERERQRAGSLSGGEQQMLAIGRALMTNPRLLVLDEATEGLAPLVRAAIWRALAEARRQGGLTLLVIDKSPRELAAVAERGAILERGRTVWSGPMDELDAALARRHLGL